MNGRHPILQKFSFCSEFGKSIDISSKLFLENGCKLEQLLFLIRLLILLLLQNCVHSTKLSSMGREESSMACTVMFPSELNASLHTVGGDVFSSVV